MLRRPNSRRNGLVALGAALLAGGFAILPLVIREKRADRNLMLSDSALSGSQIMRGNYLNSGACDATKRVFRAVVGGLRASGTAPRRPRGRRVTGPT